MTSGPVDSPPQVPPPPLPTQAVTLVCANCGAALQGKYCTACGQRHEPHVHSVGHFMHEAFESLTHADSRVWRTLWLLVSRPARLTREFFAGRRASYLPPFRLYLVISVVFFVIMGLPGGEPPETPAAASARRVSEMGEVARALETDLAATPGAADMAKTLRERAAQQQAALDDATRARDAARPGTPTDDFAQGMQENNVLTEFCAGFAAGGGAGEPGDRSHARVQKFCAQTEADRGKAVIEATVHSIPRAMFVFLPLLALFMKVLYWRPKRYYVEHLTLLVHNHAFVFLALGILGLIDLVPVVRDHTGLLTLAVWLYMMWYVYRALRNYYGQGRALTFAKFCLLGLAYLTTSLAVLLIAGIFSIVFV